MLPCRSGSRLRGTRLGFLYFLLGGSLALAGSKHHKASPTPSPSASASKEDVGLKNIPLTIGHEAKGLVLPNYDLEGHLVGKFDAEKAARLDENHVRFTSLKMQTFDQQQKPDINVTMTDGILNLETKVIESTQRTTLQRTDFQISGDTMSFSTVTHEGQMTGKVHMTLYNQKEIGGSALKK
jgi:hypothetical protein